MITLGLIKTRAVVIKSQDYKENDKIVWLFTEEFGKISVLVRGVKKKNSHFVSGATLFSYGNYLLFAGKGMYTMNEVMVIESFKNLMASLETLAYGSYVCELINMAIPDKEENKELFKLLVSTLYLIKNQVSDPELLSCAFLLKLLRITGYDLSLENCSICGEKIATSNNFSLNNYGGVCSKCSKERTKYISYSAYNIIKFLNSASLDKVCILNISKGDKSEISKMIQNLTVETYGKKPNSLDTLNYLKGVMDDE